MHKTFIRRYLYTTLQGHLHVVFYLICTWALPGYAQSEAQNQKSQSFNLTCHIAYLPSFYNETEHYDYTGARLKHQYCTQKAFRSLRWKSCKPFLDNNKATVLYAVDYIAKTTGAEQFAVVLTAADKDSLLALCKKKNYLGQPLYGVDQTDVKPYIESSDTITIQFNQFNTEYSRVMDQTLTVIDGCPFSISLDLISEAHDTTRYTYEGNLFDGVRDTQVDEFLIYYTLYQTSPIFEHLPLDTYFTRQQLYKIILRYIAYAEYKIKRENYFDLDSP